MRIRRLAERGVVKVWRSEFSRYLYGLTPLRHSPARMTQCYAHLAKSHISSEMEIFAAGMPGSGQDAPSAVLEKAIC